MEEDELKGICSELSTAATGFSAVVSEENEDKGAADVTLLWGFTSFEGSFEISNTAVAIIMAAKPKRVGI